MIQIFKRKHNGKYTLFKRAATLRGKIIRLMTLTLLSSTLAILATAWITTTQHAHDSMNKEINIAQSILQRTLMSLNDQLTNSAQLLTADFGFKRAVATQDKNTMEDVLKNHGSRIQADLMAIIDLEGMVIASTSDDLLENNSISEKSLLAHSLEDEGALSFIELNKKLYQVILLPVKAPNNIAIAMVGFKVDEGFLEELSMTTHQLLTLTLSPLSEKKFNPFTTQDLTITTLTPEEFQDSKQHYGTTVNFLEILFNAEHVFISQSNIIHQSPSIRVVLTISKNAQSIFANFIRLQIQITLIAMLAILLGLITARIIAKNITRPLRELATNVQRISIGEYTSIPRPDDSTSEIIELAEAFTIMQDKVQTREASIKFHAEHDTLTGLLNRDKIISVFSQKIQQQSKFKVICFKIMELRSIFDIFGYSIGEYLIIGVANRLKDFRGQTARLNGGEFLWIPDAWESTDALMNFKSILELPYFIEDQTIRIHLALSEIQAPQHANEAGALLRRINITGDAAQQSMILYSTYSEKLENDYLLKLEILNELKNEIRSENPRFTLNFQPKIRLPTFKAERAEALIRWTSERLGFIPPDVFIPIAEQAGLIHSITEWVIKEVIKAQKNWQAEGINIQVAINLSIIDIENDNMLPYIVNQMIINDIQPNALSFEVTEGELMNNPQNAIKQLQAYRDQGFDLSIDDFGTGYSSLAYLKNLPIGELKIDKAFILKLGTEKNDQSIVETVLSLAARFQLESVAEGVEDLQSLNLLIEWGCEWAQGFYIARPIAQHEFAQWYKDYDGGKIFQQAFL